MAYSIGTGNSRDVISARKAIGVLVPFADETVFVPTYSTLEACKVNLYNLLMTGRGERYLNPGLGSNLLQYLFSQASDYANIQATITSEVERYFPNIQLQKINLEEYPEDNLLQVSIHFRIKGTNLEDNLTLDIER